MTGIGPRHPDEDTPEGEVLGEEARHVTESALAGGVAGILAVTLATAALLAAAAVIAILVALVF